jgi:PAS domain S-box-containing protein
MRLSIERKNLFFLTLSSIGLISVLITFFVNTQEIKLNNILVEHTQQVLHKSDNILTDILNIETSSRGFIITGSESFLEPYNTSIITINSNLKELAILTWDNSIQLQRIKELRSAVIERLEFAKLTIKLRREDGLKETAKLIAYGRGKILMNKVRNILSSITNEELKLLTQRKNESIKNSENNEWIFLLLVAVIILFVAVILKNQNVRKQLTIKEKQVSSYARSLIEASLDPLVTISPEGKILDVNGASILATGVERDRLIGTNFSNYFTQPLEAEKGYHQVFEKGFVSDYPLTIKHQDGSSIDVLYNASVYKDEEGNVLGVFAAARNVTKSKKAEEELHAVNKELEGFTYSVSHDLRAPLRAINGFSRILIEDYTPILDEEGIKTLNSILSNSKRMGELIDDLLAFSRLGRKEVTMIEINMNGLVKAAREEEMLDNKSDIEFVVHELLPAKGQQALIKQVWVNLISNAIKYSKYNTKTKIEIGSSYKNNMVQYFISDIGAGFDMKYYDKLFGVFQRLHSNEEFEGTGIGLAIIKKIINRHGGKVWAESEVNKGTTFYFTLPKINL